MLPTGRNALRCAGLLAGLLWSAAPSLAADSPPAADALQARYAEMRPQLARSPFRRPLLLQSNDSTSAPLGEVWAVLDQPFDAVAALLRQPQHWCDILLLQTNVKRCAPAGANGQGRLDVAVARRYTDAADQAQSLSFNFDVPARLPDYLSVSLSADQGPVGTQNYRLRFSAVPAGARQTFMHLSYAYETGLAARLATSAYLASAGKDKVGFTIAGRDAEGRPQYVRGMQGVAERNTMRYFLAIESFLGTASAPVEERLRSFHAALERYPAQLHETEQDEYLAMKRREIQLR
ncbi:hypothetical protein [Azohydromonas caseinilytica]|uniref:Uncharacterized protein n=1 Tax=Azohydromonas caseinilytica TaxID=2728836 RepID=A0A848FI14_9BURK|nr:hypothetical protein [Azohydromonas caseinilytica]NML18786.1 hypothetical protein [Azohydromonas caseinilytica]